MIILGQNSDDKGKQLEALTRNLLQDLGYQNIVTNSIGLGGAEIDVRGKYAQPVPGGQQLMTMICECKAQREPVGTTQWLKFLGKVFTEEALTNQNVSGCFIALSGVNGNVSGAYEELRRHCSNVSLVTDDDLQNLVSERFQLCGIAKANETLRSYTDRQVTETNVAYYDNKLYWLIYFEDRAFTLLSAFGLTVSPADIEQLRPLLDENVVAAQYVDLAEEKLARLQRAQLRNRILGTIMLGNGKASGNEINSEDDTPNQASHISEVLDALVADGLVEFSLEEALYSFPSEEGIGFDDIMAQVFVLMLKDGVASEVIGCPYYDRVIADYLITHIQEVQGRLPLTDEERQHAVTLLQLSPSALLQTLRPDGMMAEHGEHRNDANAAAAVNEHDVNYFFRLLFNCLVADYSSPSLHDYFYYERKIRELETRQVVSVKTDSSVILSKTISSRLGLGILTPELGGHVVAVSMLPNAAQFWSAHTANTIVEQVALAEYTDLTS